jgi:DNA-binding NarL/FixJ family response regulator
MLQSPEIKVLIAHSNPLISAGLSTTLGKQRNFRVAVRSAEPTASPGRTRLPFVPDVIVADYDSGVQLVASRCTAYNRVVILTHSDSEAKICNALEQGARGYLLLGCSLKDLTEGLRSMHVGGIALGPLVTTRMAEWLKQEALTRREAEILGEMMFGLCNKQIASNLALAVGTVKAHVKSILNKLHAASRTEAVAIAQRRGILGEEREWRHREPWARRPIKRPDLDRRPVMAREFMGQPDSRGGACDISADAAEPDHARE